MPTPLVQQGRGRLGRVASTIRRQQFITKTELGPQTVQAITEGELEQERLERQSQSRFALGARLETERLAESTRRFDVLREEERRERKEREAAIKRSRIAGGAKGAVGGAAVGFAVGGPVGAVVGGIIGVVTGGK